MEQLLTHLDALLVSKPANIYYLCGFKTPSPTDIDAFLLVTQSCMYILVSPLYQEQAEGITKQKHRYANTSEVLVLDRQHTLSQYVDFIAQKHDIKTIGIEQQHLSISLVDHLKSHTRSIRFVYASGVIETLRIIKTKHELSAIQKAAELTDNCFVYLQKQIQEGQSEKDISWMIESYIKTHGQELAFTPIVAFNDHSSQPHYQAQDNTKLTKQSLILLDYGASFRGYASDMTRILFWGTPKTEWTRAYNTVREAQERTLEQVTLYSQTHEIQTASLDTIARTVIEKKGYPSYPHSLGHAVGLEIHEMPTLSPFSQDILKAGMTITIEPGIYLPGKFGIRIEDLIIIEKTGYTNITHAAKDIIVL